MVDITRRTFLHDLGEIAVYSTGLLAASVVGGIGLTGLIQGCESEQQRPTWGEVNQDYLLARSRRQRVHKGTFADRMRWLTEKAGDEGAKEEILNLWVLGEQGDNPATTYTEVVLPGIRDYVDFYFRRVMEAPGDYERYRLAGEQLRNLDLLLFKLQNQIEHGKLTPPPGTFRADTFMQMETNGTRTRYGYYDPELHALRNAKGKLFDEHASDQLTREQYLALIAPMTSDPNLVIKTTYQPGR